MRNFLKRKNNRIYENWKKEYPDKNKVWKSILLIFTIINVCVIIFSWYLFFQISNGGIFNIKQDINVSVETINRKLLKDTITAFEIKENEFEKLKVSGPGVVDPSLQ